MARQGLNIRDIAKRVGVSPGTVSRALSNGGGVGEETRRKILALAETLQYKPRLFRRSLCGGIGLLIGSKTPYSVDNEFLDEVIAATASRASKRGLHLQLDFVLRDEESRPLPKMIEEGLVDGVIMAGFPPSRLCAAVKELKLPAVVLHDSASRTSLPCVQHNNFAAARELVSKLVELGHRRIAFVATDRKFSTIEHRYQGYREALEQAGIAFDPSLLLEGAGDSLAGGRDAVDKLLGSNAKPSAIFFSNDWMAIGGMAELAARGLKIPADVSVAGAGNFRQSAQAAPPLTAIDTPWGDTVEAALDILEAAIKREGERTGKALCSEFVMDCGIVWRASCAAPKRALTT